MNKAMKLAVLCACALLSLSACGFEETRDGNNTMDLDVNPYSVDQSESNPNRVEPLENGGTDQPSYQVISNDQDIGEVQTIRRKGMNFVPLVEVLEMLDYQVLVDEQSLKAGFTDVLININMETNTTHVEGEQVQLNTEPEWINDQLMVSTHTLNQLLGDTVQVSTKQGRLQVSTDEDIRAYGFQPNESLDELPVENEEEDVPAVSTQTADRIIRSARRFMNVPYVFGSPSGYTKTFDCSSFTQYIYNLHGIDLPRVSRHQAKLGTYVPVSKLKKGDLLFFNWPGRFNSSRIVGHVGIYAGNGLMIHSSPYPKDGVQIENLKNKNSLYRDVYLGAKRLSG